MKILMIPLILGALFHVSRADAQSFGKTDLRLIVVKGPAVACVGGRYYLDLRIQNAGKNRANVDVNLIGNSMTLRSEDGDETSLFLDSPNRRSIVRVLEPGQKIDRRILVSVDRFRPLTLGLNFLLFHYENTTPSYSDASVFTDASTTSVAWPFRINECRNRAQKK